METPTTEPGALLSPQDILWLETDLPEKRSLRSAGRGWREHRVHRTIARWRGRIPQRNTAIPARQDVPAPSGPARLHTQGQRNATSAGYSNDADLKGYFDSIPHDKLMACLQHRISDRHLPKLIRLWLEAPVQEPPPTGGGKARVYRNRQGTPQGGIISPLLANLYLHWFDYIFYRSDGPGRWAHAKLVRYADDFVVLARYQSDRLVDFIEKNLEQRFGLEINRNKTRLPTAQRHDLLRTPQADGADLS